MAENDVLVETPFLERVLGQEADRVVEIGFGLEKVTESVANNLRWVLNSHVQGVPDRLSSLLDESSLRFGVPDVPQFSATADGVRELHTLLQSIIASFEPRLAHIEVHPLGIRSSTVHFRVEAVLRLRFETASVAFRVNVRLLQSDIDVEEA